MIKSLAQKEHSARTAGLRSFNNLIFCLKTYNALLAGHYFGGVN